MKETRKVIPPLPADKGTASTVCYPCLSAEEVLKIITDNFRGVPITTNKYGTGNWIIFILPEAMTEFDAMVGWGRTTPFNIYEQLYQGMGHVFVDKAGRVTLVITHFLYIYAADRAPLSACVHKDSYNPIMERIALERRIFNKNEISCNKSPNGYCYNPFVEKYGKSIAILYGHTHPNIGVFFSSDDHTSGFASHTLPAATFVADPIRKDMKAMIGIDERDARIITLRYAAPSVSEVKEVVEIDVRKEAEAYGVSEAYEEILRCCNAINTSGERAFCKVSEKKGLGGSLRIKASVKWIPGKKAGKNHEIARKGYEIDNDAVKRVLSQPAKQAGSVFL